MFVTNWISTAKIQKYRRLPTFLGTISYPELRYVLSINPEYHTKLFPDSILTNELKYDLIQDVSETNSIYKIYVCWMGGG